MQHVVVYGKLAAGCSRVWLEAAMDPMLYYWWILKSNGVPGTTIHVYRTFVPNMLVILQHQTFIV